MTGTLFFEPEWALATALASLSGLTPGPGLWWVSLDEVGRGSVAGPVVACASVWAFRAQAAATLDTEKQKLFEKHIKDSKRLSEKKRDMAARKLLDCLPDTHPLRRRGASTGHVQSSGLVPELMTGSSLASRVSPAVHYPAERLSGTAQKPRNGRPPGLDAELLDLAIGQASAFEIDRHNIWESTQIAICRALEACQIPDGFGFILFDGKLASKVPPSLCDKAFVTAIGGDAAYKSIAASSIVAKVHRDALVSELGEVLPGYELEKNKGYGTAAHFAAIRTRGLSPEHRRSFLKTLLEEQSSEARLF